MTPTFRRALLACGAGLLAAALIGAPAEARHKKRHRHYTAQAPISQPMYAQPPVCRQMCVTDMSPCDPPQMKTIDGRCSNPMGGPLF